MPGDEIHRGARHEGRQDRDELQTARIRSGRDRPDRVDGHGPHRRRPVRRAMEGELSEAVATVAPVPLEAPDDDPGSAEHDGLADRKGSVAAGGDDLVVDRGAVGGIGGDGEPDRSVPIDRHGGVHPRHRRVADRAVGGGTPADRVRPGPQDERLPGCGPRDHVECERPARRPVGCRGGAHDEFVAAQEVELADRATELDRPARSPDREPGRRTESGGGSERPTEIGADVGVVDRDDHVAGVVTEAKAERDVVHEIDRTDVWSGWTRGRLPVSRPPSGVVGERSHRSRCTTRSRRVGAPERAAGDRHGRSRIGR